MQYAVMFLRRHTKLVGDCDYTYWSLVRTIRTAKGPRHELVAHLGKLTPTEAQQAREWSELDALLDGTPPAQQLPLGQPTPPPPAPLWRTVNIGGVRVERVRQFGRVYVALALWRRLRLHTLLQELLPAGEEAVRWELVGCVLTLARFCAQPSELAVAERWYADSALADLLGVPQARINETRLYRGLDVLLAHKEELGKHLLERYRSWFGTRFEFLIYDVTSTYFEGLAENNELAARGYSRDHRPDCKQVCIGLVVTPEGLPVAYEVFAGNRTDVTTVEAMVELLEKKDGQAQRVWVMDRGMVSEANLTWLRERGALYLVGTPKSQLRQFEKQLLDQAEWHTVREGLEVKLVVAAAGTSTERYVLCRSRERGAKERAMLDRQIARLRGEFAKLDAALQKQPVADAGPVERRIGKWLGRSTAAAKLFAVTLRRDAQQRVCGLDVREQKEKLEWARHAHGAYLLRTNHPAADPAELWRWYIQLTQAEAAFRVEKSDLGWRPVFHQKTERVQAHILVCFLALALWRTLEQWMASKGLGSCARQLLKELDKLHSMDVVLPTDTGVELRLRVVAQPEKELGQLLAHLGLGLPQRPKLVANVVPKTASQSSQVTANQAQRFPD
jgi:transposase